MLTLKFVRASQLEKKEHGQSIRNKGEMEKRCWKNGSSAWKKISEGLANEGRPRQRYAMHRQAG